MGTRSQLTLRGLAAMYVVVMLGGAKQLQPDDAPVHDDVLSQKISGYIDCINEHRNSTYESRDRYFSWLESPEAGPTGREQVVAGLFELRDPADCVARIRAASDLPPDMPALEAAARAWAEALQRATTIVDEANRYYEVEDYRDDDLQRGKELHGPLLQAFTRFEEADEAFYPRAVAEQDGISGRRLEALAADPAMRGEYLLAQLPADARKLVEGGKAAGTDTFDRESYTATVRAFQATYAELDSYLEDHTEFRTSWYAKSSYLNKALELLKSAKALARREREGMKFDTTEQTLIDGGAPDMVKGHPADLIDEYNDFIDEAGRID